MKKRTLFIAALLIVICASAQTANRSLLSGQWSFSSFANNSMALNVEEPAKTVKQMLKTIQARDAKSVASTKDSLLLVEKIEYAMRQVDSSYINFTKDGDVTLMLYLDVDGGRGEEHKGTYKWTGNNTFVVYFGEDVSQFTVKTLTEKEFVAIGNDDKPADEKLYVSLRK